MKHRLKRGSGVATRTIAVLPDTELYIIYSVGWFSSSEIFLENKEVE